MLLRSGECRWRVCPVEASLVAPDQIQLSAPTVHDAVEVRYASSNVLDVNVFSSSGLPLVPFFSEILNN